MTVIEPNPKGQPETLASLLGGGRGAFDASLPVVGFVGGASAELFAGPARAFRQGLKEDQSRGRPRFLHQRAMGPG